MPAILRATTDCSRLVIIGSIMFLPSPLPEQNIHTEYICSSWGWQVSLTYIANARNTSTVTICQDVSTVTQCSTSDGDGTFNLPTDVAFFGGRAYVTNSANNSVSVCNQPATLTSCTISTGNNTFSSPVQITFYGGLAYVTNIDQDSLSICTPDLLSCSVSTGDGILTAPFQVAFSNGLAYITGTGVSGGEQNTSLTTCTNPTTLSGCTKALIGGGLGGSGIAFNGGLVYLTNLYYNYVAVCTNITDLASCTNSTGDGTFFTPLIIKFNAGLAYVSNSLNNTVSVCRTTNNLTDCTVSNAKGTLSYPAGIAFYTYETVRVFL